MFCHVELFCVVLICTKPSGADGVKPSLADQLNATLSNEGWLRISNVGAKLPFAVNGHESFTGKDMFVSLSFENENSINTLVGDDNAAVKHYMVTHLMGCIYVNAMVKFMDLLRIIFEEVKRAKKNIRDTAYRKKMKKLHGANKGAEEAVPDQIETSDNTRDRPTDENIVDFKEPWEILNFALLQLTDSSIMFDLMISTIRYLIDMIPSNEPFGYDPHIREFLVIEVLPCLQLFKDRSRNINLVLPKYIGKTDPDYIDKVSPFASQFQVFLNGHADTVMLPFLDRFCTVSGTSRLHLQGVISLFKTKYGRKPVSLDLAHELGEEIRQLVLEVSNNYHSQLGILYDVRQQKTSYAISPTV